VTTIWRGSKWVTIKANWPAAGSRRNSSHPSAHCLHRSCAPLASFTQRGVINLRSSLGPNIDLTFGYNLDAGGSGGFGFDVAFGGAVPETSTWAMMLLGFAGLGAVGSWATRRSVES
jgi:hypothetical protein